jgi:acyl-coenzyme A thioesterase PaaI-like protein
MPAYTRPDDLRRSVCRDLAWSSLTGAPPLGHLAGLHRMPTNDGSYALAIDPSRPFMAGGAGILELVMLADLALGGAIRNQVGLTLPLPTVSMTLQLAPRGTSEVAWADGECTSQLDCTATARSRLRNAAGDIVGDATGVFALPRLPYDGPGRPMPWDVPTDATSDRDGDGALNRDEGAPSSWVPGPAEEVLLNRVTAHADGSQETAWGTSHVKEQMATGDALALVPTELMANRLGHIQGGALFTAAVLAAARVGEFPVESLVTGTIEFIEAARLGALLVPEVTVLRASGRSLFASVLLVQDGSTCCHVTPVFRR